MAERGEVGVGFLRRAHVRLGDDFAERSAATVVVNVSLGGGLRETFVEIFGSVFFEMEARDADASSCAVGFDLQPATGGERQFVLGNLVALGEVGIEIVFASEAGMVVDRAVQGERGAHGHLDGALVEHGQSAGEAEADGTDIGVRRIAEASGAAAEDFCAREELDVDLQADDGLVFGEHVGRDGGDLWSGFRHKGTKIIASGARRDGPSVIDRGATQVLHRRSTAKSGCATKTYGWDACCRAGKRRSARA